MNPRVKHVLGLLATIATAIGTIWVGTSTPVSTKIAQSLIVALALAFNKAKATQIEHAF